MQLALQAEMCASLKIHWWTVLISSSPDRCMGVPGSFRQHDNVILQMETKPQQSCSWPAQSYRAPCEDLLVKSRMFSTSHVHMNIVKWWKWLHYKCGQIVHEKSRSSIPRAQQTAHLTVAIPLKQCLMLQQWSIPLSFRWKKSYRSVSWAQIKDFSWIGWVFASLLSCNRKIDDNTRTVTTTQSFDCSSIFLHAKLMFLPESILQF